MQVERILWCSNTSLVSGERVSNTWATCPEVGDSPPKGGLIPHDDRGAASLRSQRWPQGLTLPDGPAAYQLVGEVTAHQGYDG